MKYLIEKRLNEILKQRGIEQKQICRDVGIETKLFNMSMNYERELKATELLSVCYYAGIDLNSFKNIDV